MSELPHMYKTGRYMFYGICAFSNSTMSAVAFKAMGAADLVISAASYAGLVITFLTLRDMDKNARAPLPSPIEGAD